MGAGWGQPMPVACPLAQFCRAGLALAALGVQVGGCGPPFHGDGSLGTEPQACFTLLGEKLWDLRAPVG